ncbi:hypothetical protein VIGAN_04125800 [Vigna angularis var. angularis]|uniref:Uncharacterized protein n=1 Tax=Vigna angularis var. angularis TaxID=157739 RepID=A0A0S3RTV4_PHAAN|nr:hypothetical protein VIGAN_04125800 [Vigna angularis var. angularis]
MRRQKEGKTKLSVLRCGTNSAAVGPDEDSPPPPTPATPTKIHLYLHLLERLALLDPNNNNNIPATSRKPPSTAVDALKALFRPPAHLELHRTKSFSASKNELFSTSFEPQRKSCDVRIHITLSNLFHQYLKPQNDKPL